VRRDKRVRLPGPSRRHEVPFGASLKHSSTDWQTWSACDRDGRPFPAGPGRHTRRWIDHLTCHQRGQPRSKEEDGNVEQWINQRPKPPSDGVMSAG
jgi:hypothetical protein